MLICNNLQALAPLATLVPQLANPCLGEGSPMIRIHNQPSDFFVFAVISYQPGEFCWVHLDFHLYQLWSPDSGYSSNTGCFFLHWYPPKKLKYGKPRLGECTLTSIGLDTPNLAYINFFVLKKVQNHNILVNKI